MSRRFTRATPPPRSVPDFRVTVAIPTLTAGEALAECLASLSAQNFQAFEIIVIDNSGRGLVREQGHGANPRARILEMTHNVGFGAAINAAILASTATYVATLNDDAVASAQWLNALATALDARPDAGMCASQVRLAGESVLDSAGMLLAADGSSKQRGHMRRPEDFNRAGEVLLPSASAALYRRAMLDEIGAFDADFFLYCEDTDLGLRAVRAGWRCLYEPAARVEHRYSHSAGRASALKAYYVERNRLFVAIKNFPPRMLWGVPFAAAARYAWHLIYLARGRGAAACFSEQGNSAWTLPWLVLKAHASALVHLPRLLGKRRAIRRTAKLSPGAFTRIVRRFSIPARAIARL
jgi:GT2 family glycosyltransferase